MCIDSLGCFNYFVLFVCMIDWCAPLTYREPWPKTLTSLILSGVGWWLPAAAANGESSAIRENNSSMSIDTPSMSIDTPMDDTTSASSSSTFSSSFIAVDPLLDDINNNSNHSNNNINNDDASSVISTSSSKTEERRRKRDSWRAQHDDQLRADLDIAPATRRRSKSSSTSSTGSSLPGSSTKSQSEVSARVLQHLGTKSTAKPHTLPPTVSDDVRVRSNLLRTLGISNTTINKGVQHAMMGGTNNIINSGGHSGGGAAHQRAQSMGGVGVTGGDTAFEPQLRGAKLVLPGGRSLLSDVRFKEGLKYDSDDDVDPYVPRQQSNYNILFGGSGSARQRRRSRSRSNSPNPRHNNTTGAMNDNHNTNRRRKLTFHDEVQIVPIPMRSEYSNRIKERMYSGRVELSENAQRNVVEFESEGWDATTVLEDETQFYKCPLTGELIHPVHLAYFNKTGEGAGYSSVGGNQLSAC